MSCIRAIVLILLLGIVNAHAAAVGEVVPPDSIHQLRSTFTDQHGATFQLADRRGHVQLVAMFYTSCQYVCPLIVDTVKGIEHALTAEERARLRILLVSIDPDRDDVAALKKVSDQRRLDPIRWTLARTDAGEVRKLAAVLGVRYRGLIDGEFNHTSAVVLLDGDGRKLAASSRLGSEPDAEFLEKVRAALAAAD